MKFHSKVVFQALVLLAVIFTASCQSGAQMPGEAELTLNEEPRSLPTSMDFSAYPWWFLRDEQPLTTYESMVTLIAVGDVNIGRGVAMENDPFDRAAWLKSANLAFANLESAIASSASDVPVAAQETPLEPIRLIAPPEASSHLKQAGFDLLSLANNHSLDLGPPGLAEMSQRLQAEGMDTLGAGLNQDAAYQPAIREINGLKLTFLAFSAVQTPDQVQQLDGWQTATWERERALQAVGAASEQADAVVVSMHWGYEYQTRVDPVQREMARLLVEAGADLVIGHHPHVAQTYEIFPGQEGERSGFVVYSLGNFLFDQAGEETSQGIALHTFFDKEGLRAVQALPVHAGLRPSMMSLDDGASLLARLQPPPRDIAFSCTTDSCHSIEVPVLSAGAIPKSAEIDLTGDLAPEQIDVREQRMTIYQDGVEAWRSPEDWKVIDFAVGDPNMDGRGELMLALNKPDRQGIPGSHPFIFGYRDGLYRTLWGGSPVADPILELELADIDGDGEDELIVLEQKRGSTKTAVTFWRWHGWGFSLQWRSPYGDYSNLRVLEESGSPNAILLVTQR